MWSGHCQHARVSTCYSQNSSWSVGCWLQVSVAGSVVVEKLMEVERYSHVMHISSTVTGRLLPSLDAWDALRAALPAGTVSGAPKVSWQPIILLVALHSSEMFG